MIKLEQEKTFYYFFTKIENGKVVARAYLFEISNSLHSESYGLLEDVWVDEESRGKGYGKEIVQSVIEKARLNGYYKLIATSRTERDRVHALYKQLGFAKHGFEFRMDFKR